MSCGKIILSLAPQKESMYLEEGLTSQPSKIGRCFTQTALKNSLWGKSLSENHSSTVASAITMSENTGTSAQMMAHGVLIHQMILILIKAIRIEEQSGYYSSAPATDMNSIRTLNSIHNLLFLQYPNQKSKGTSYCSSTIHSNHDNSL